MLYRRRKARYFAANLIILALVFLFGSSCGIVNKWTPRILSEEVQSEHYLPDFSYAGYRWGEKVLPESKTTLSVSTFGAVPDDGKDDTQALQKALAAAHEVEGKVVLSFPAGKFIIRDILFIHRSHFVLQGAGSGKEGTCLHFPRPLNDLPVPEIMEELQEYLKGGYYRQHIRDLGVKVPYSLYAWTGGLIWTGVKGKRIKRYVETYDTDPEILAKIKSGKRGQHKITVHSASQLKVGQLVSIEWYNREGKASTLIDHIYDHQNIEVGKRHWINPDWPLTSQEVMITAISGDTVTIKSPLMHDARPEWTPQMTKWEHLEEVGIEHLSISFPFDLYNAHHVEDGYNGIFLSGLAHSWVRDIKINNGDSGVITEDCANVTIQNLETTGRNYHYTIMFGNVYNMLAKQITVNAPCKHSLSCNSGSRRCVFTDCDINVQPTLDQHRAANMQNCFDNIRILDREPFHSFFGLGGAGYWRPAHGAFSTFWNIKLQLDYPYTADTAIQLKGIKEGPSARLIGITANYPIEISYGPNAYKEGINKRNIAVPSLYQYQLEKRMEKF